MISGYNLYSFVKEQPIERIDLLGLRGKNTKVYDDFGNECCSDEMRSVVKYTLLPFAKKHHVGHSFIYCPTVGYRGKYPAGNSVVSGGEIRDDESLYRQYEKTNRLVVAAVYKACPSSYRKMAKLISRESSNPGKYMLSGAQCEDWVNDIIESAKTPKKRKLESNRTVRKSAFQMPGTPDADVKYMETTEQQSFSIFSYGFKF